MNQTEPTATAAPDFALPLFTTDPRTALGRVLDRGWEPRELPASAPAAAVGFWGRGEERAFLCRGRAAGTFYLVVIERGVARVQG